jgi:hypothetical protein
VLRYSPRAARSDISGAAGFAAISSNAARYRQIAPLGKTVDHFKLVSQIVESCRIVSIDGARSAPVGALADIIAGLVS